MIQLRQYLVPMTTEQIADAITALRAFAADVPPGHWKDEFNAAADYLSALKLGQLKTIEVTD